MITQGEADQVAACLVLGVVQQMGHARLAEVVRAEDIRAVQDSLITIETWLRRRTLGGDKIAIRQTEKELGRQLRMRGKR